MGKSSRSFIEIAQRLSGEISDLGIVALPFELGDHDHWEHHRVFREAEDGLWIRQQHRRVEHIGALDLRGVGACRPITLRTASGAGLV
jgi:hypothetical protein